MPLLGFLRRHREPAPPPASLASPAGSALPGSRGLRVNAGDIRGAPPRGRRTFFESCSNPWCRSGWMQLLRGRTSPVFEGGWSCSPSCTGARMAAAVRRALEGRSWERDRHRHRIPLGLVMLEQGWISPEALRAALNAQREAGSGPLGWWLVRQQAVSEQTVARALGLQWSCPVLAADPVESAGLASVVPRLFVDAFGALPLRLAAGRLLYLGFEERPDPVLALAVGEMSGLEVESGIVPASQFRPAQARMLEAAYPEVKLIEAATPEAAARALAQAVERVQPEASRLVRVHECLWLRLWRRLPAPPLPAASEVEDVICSFGAG